jgi:hypothetical protein
MMSDVSDDGAARLAALKELPPLMPQFLKKRRVGVPAVVELSERLGVDRPTFFSLVQVHRVVCSYSGGTVTPAQLRASNPYQVVDNLTEPLSALKAKGLVVERKGGALALSEEAAWAISHLHAAGREFVAQHKPLPADELELLALQLERGLDAVTQDPILSPRPGSHLAGTYAFGPLASDAPAMVRIEQAIYSLWGARDDAHMKAWRDAELEGPPLAVLTLVWNSVAHTVGELAEALKGEQTPADIEGSLDYLVERDLIVREGDEVQMSPEGVLVRDDIERETDRIYFASWPHTMVEALWLAGKLRELVDNLPTPPQAPG